MIEIRTSDDFPIVLDVFIRKPSVYLDQAVISKFSTDQVLGTRFREILLSQDGTLCVSSIHLMESLGLGFGPTLQKIKAFLAGIGKRFVVLDFDPNTVITKERQWKPGDPCPGFDIQIIKQVALQWNGLASFDFALLLDGLDKNPNLSDRYKVFQNETKDDLYQIMQTARREYRTNKTVRAIVKRAPCPEPKTYGTTEYLNCMLRRECIMTNEEFTLTDGPDFYHSIVSTSYCDFVVLDKKWARRLQGIALPRHSARVFSTIEIDQFLANLATFNGGLTSLKRKESRLHKSSSGGQARV